MQADDKLDWIKTDACRDATTGDEIASVCGDIVLEGRLGIAEAEAMHAVFGQILQAGVDISIESDALSRVDAAGVQLLYALVRQAQKNKINVTWLSPSDALRQAVEVMGLSQAMGLSALEPAS